MNFSKRAFTSIKSRPLKSLTLFTLVFVLGSIIIGAITIQNAVMSTEANLRNQMRPLVGFEMDIASLANDDGTFNSALAITTDIARQVAELPQVRQHHYMIGTHFQTQQLLNYFISDEQHFDDDFPSQFNLQGGSSAIPLQFSEGVLNLISGSYFETDSLAITSDAQPIIISQALAQTNNLMLGSIIELAINVLRPQASQLGTGPWEENWHLNPDNVYATEVFELEIVGLFDVPVAKENANAAVNDRKEQLLNLIFTTNQVAETIVHFQTYNFVSVWEAALAEIGTTVEAFFGRDLLEETPFESVMELYNAREIDDFRAAADQLLPDYWLITDLSNSFEAISSAMDTLQTVGQWVLIGSVGASILILSLLVVLYLRDRRSEIGMYVALGEKKLKIILQILIEITVPAMAGLSIAVFTGSLISENISRFMLQNELTTQQANHNFFRNRSLLERFGFYQEMPVDEMLATFEISLNLTTVSLFLGVGMVIIMLFTIVPISYISNLNPKKILTHHD